MREIKFRAWDKKYSKIEPDVIKNLPWTGRTFEDVVKDDRYILMQYTGLKDKNGKEIYEGDLLKGYYYPFMKTDQPIENPTTHEIIKTVTLSEPQFNYLLEIFWSDEQACFCGCFRKVKNAPINGISHGISEYLENFNFSEMEVVGNIYENSNMVEEL